MRWIIALAVAVALLGGAAKAQEEGDGKGAAAPRDPAEPAAVEGEGAAEGRVGFAQAIAIARERYPGMPPSAVALHVEEDELFFEVTLLADDGTRGVRVDASSGEVLESSHAIVDPVRAGFTPDLRPALLRSGSDLADALRHALQQQEEVGVLREVAFQSYRGDLVVEAVYVSRRGERLGRLIDAGTGEPITTER